MSSANELAQGLSGDLDETLGSCVLEAVNIADKICDLEMRMYRNTAAWLRIENPAEDLRFRRMQEQQTCDLN